MWEVEYTDEFSNWWELLTEAEQIDVAASVNLLEELGPKLQFPYSSGIIGSKHTHMRELRIQCNGKPYRVLYAFDPRRIAILLLGGNKTGDKDWYLKNVRLADILYDKHLMDLTTEGLVNDKVL